MISKSAKRVTATIPSIGIALAEMRSPASAANRPIPPAPKAKAYTLDRTGGYRLSTKFEMRTAVVIARLLATLPAGSIPPGEHLCAPIDFGLRHKS